MNLSFQTTGFCGYSVKFWPFAGHRLACSAAQNFGIAGCGRLFIVDNVSNSLNCLRAFDWPTDGLYDVCWSEVDSNIIWSCSGDGHLQVWNVESGSNEPVQVIKAHSREIYSCDWTQVRHDPPAVVTGSWDKSVKMWDAGGRLTGQFLGHDSLVYTVMWSPRLSSTFASTSADSTLRIWSARQDKPGMVIKAGDCEVLTCDWCKYNEHVIATGSTDGVIHGWDLRSPATPIFSLMGHSKAVKRVKFSPFQESLLASVSYDFTTRIWDSNLMKLCASPLLLLLNHHSEFVYGLDFNLHIQNQLTDCAWDQLVHVFNFNSTNL